VSYESAIVYKPLLNMIRSPDRDPTGFCTSEPDPDWTGFWKNSTGSDMDIQVPLCKRMRPGCVRALSVWDWSSNLGKYGLWRHRC